MAYWAKEINAIGCVEKNFSHQSQREKFIFSLLDNKLLHLGLLNVILPKAGEINTNEGVTFADFSHIYA